MCQTEVWKISTGISDVPTMVTLADSKGGGG